MIVPSFRFQNLRPSLLLLAFLSLSYLLSFAGAREAIQYPEQSFMVLDSGADLPQWQISLSEDWDVLGPFPIHAREQHLLNPGFPLNLTVPYEHEPNQTWTSPYADNAQVTWSKAHSDAEGKLAVSYPDIRWSYLRATDGWAAVQHHSILHTTLTVTPLRKGPSWDPLPRLLVKLKQGSFFTVLPREVHEPFVPQWHAGNIYGLLRDPPNAVELPGTVSNVNSTTFDFFISGDYEIRLFGDPRDYGEERPTLKLNVSVSVEEKRKAVVRQQSHDVVCDFVDGYAFGDALGVGLRSVDGWWIVENIQLPGNFPKALALSVRNRQTLAPSQTRIVPISIEQSAPFSGGGISFTLVLSEYVPNPNLPRSRTTVPITLAWKNIPSWSASTSEVIRATFFFATSHPTAFLAKPPMLPNSDGLAVPILALHGAGVDISTMPFWAADIDRQKHSWVIMPAGRTEWGLDWHGVSASEAWASVHALSSILNPRWTAWAFPPTTEVVLLGHSNGGQGVWHLTAHYSDRVRATLAAAGYLNAQSYVPLTLSRGARFADPALRAVLESALTHDNNELFLTSGKVPILAIHGGNDTNVPSWHSREYVDVIRSWNKDANISFHEDEGKPHYYPEIFRGAHVLKFLERVLDPEFVPDGSPNHFMLTVVDPTHSGSLYGWKIDALITPGRISRLYVEICSDATHIRTTNVRGFSLDSHAVGLGKDFILDGQLQKSEPESIHRVFHMSNAGFWTRELSAASTLLWSPPGRVQNIFDTPAALTIIIPSSATAYPKALSAALRIAHALDVYLKLDAEIILDTVALSRRSTGTAEKVTQALRMEGNLIIIGGVENTFARMLLQVESPGRMTEFGIDQDGNWLFRGRPLPRTSDNSLGIVFTHPHPEGGDNAAVFLSGTDPAGLERALRLFPIRTGIAVPDWTIIGSAADNLGIGGIVGAGVWDGSWKWNEAMSWLS
ncbi:hypothetical protein M0805_003883 [Coniferiporia weirii]|nr:hypothetical protein M0805_003883 [Coniferiporia weirii]